MPTRDTTDAGCSMPDDMWEGMTDESGNLIEPTDDETSVTPAERHAVDVAEFWNARPVLAHLHAWARARMVGPWAVLGATLARVVAETSPDVQLPATIGGHASLNLFVGVVGESGDGKDAAQSVAAQAIYIENPSFRVAPLGSGEGLSHMFMRQVKATKENPFPEPEMYQKKNLVTVAEIDSMGALVQRQSSTLTSQLRQAAMGQQLGFFYADSSRRMIVPEHAYRLALIAGIQPSRSGVLLNDAEGGTPQRFVWLPSGDPGMTRNAPPPPNPLAWTAPAWAFAPREHVNGEVKFILTEPAQCVDAILTAREQRGRASDREEAANALDSHAVLTRTKVAAALAILDGRAAIDDDDWHLSGVIMAVSDTQRARCLRALRRVQEKENTAKALAEADRSVIAEEHIDRQKVTKCAEMIRRKLRVLPGPDDDGWLAHGKLNVAVGSRHREFLEPALDALSLAGEIETRKIEHRSGNGSKYRITRS